MELFEYKRYLGDPVPSPSCVNANVGLKDYLEEIKSRKRKREVNICEDGIANVENDSSEKVDGNRVPKNRSKRHKKSDRSINSEEVLNTYLGRVKLRKQKREEHLKRQQEPNDEEEKCNITGENINLESDTADRENKSGRGNKKSKENKEVEDKATDDILNNQEVKRKLHVNIESEFASVKTGKKKNNRKKKKKKKPVKDEDSEVKEEEGEKLKEKREEPIVPFEVLGAHSFENKVKVKRVLPRWLSEPTIISAELTGGKDVKTVGKIHYKLIKNLEGMGIKQLFPVQMAVVPHLIRSYEKSHYLWPRDLCVSAPTGSGKTLAFVLPILQAYYYMPKHAFYALVVLPVQELALQVAKVFRDVAAGTGIKIGCVTGGTDIGVEAKGLIYKREDGSYTNLFHILIATPGRLLEHFFLTPGFNVSNVKFIVIDEADRVVEQKSLSWLHIIERQCDTSFCGNTPPVTFYNLKNNIKGPQKLLFSATLSQDPEKLLKLNLFQPKLITSVLKSKLSADGMKNLENTDMSHFFGKFTTPLSLKESYAICDIDKKPLFIHKLLIDGWRRVLIFTKSCIEANRLFRLLKFLNPLIEIDELTSLMTLNRRQSVVVDFSNGNTSVLVCSDRMARGMDIKGVNYVVIYDPPKYAKGYIHKAGRTGRAGQSGTTLTLVTPKQTSTFLDMLNKAGKTDIEYFQYDPMDLEEFMPAYYQSLDSLKSYVSTKKHSTANHIVKEKRTKTMYNVKKRKRRSTIL